MPKATRGPRQHDVAVRAGVSHQTVSRVLNGYEGIRPETRRRVLAAIDELGYRRNAAARSLATGRSQAIGVLVPDIPNFGPTSCLYAVERAIRESGFQPLVTVTPEDRTSIEEGLDFLLDHAIEALVLMAPTHEALDVIDEKGTGVPVAYLLTGEERAPWSVSVDQAQGIELALRHLVDAGHTRIQHLAGPHYSTEARLRKDAFVVESRRLGLPLLPILTGQWTPAAGFDAGKSLDSTATAIVCANDHMALGVMHALALEGVRVPEDVSIVGYDDIPEAAHVCPPLTTIRQDFRRVGELAVEVLTAALANRELPDTAPLPAELVVRGSVAAPRTSPAAFA